MTDLPPQPHEFPSASPVPNKTSAPASASDPSDARPWSKSAAEIAETLGTDPQAGLDEAEAVARTGRFGPNALREARGRSAWRMFFGQFADRMIALLGVAVVISALVGDRVDAVIIAAIVVGNAVIGFVQERRAEQAVDALRKLSQPTARVVRGGNLTERPAAELVPGDVVELRGGDLVPADARLLEAAELTVDEAALTGESLPVEKGTDPVDADAPLPDRVPMVHAGTAVATGRARAVVTATGMRTELGRVAELLQETTQGETPLQRRLARFGNRLSLLVVAVCILVFAAGVLRVDRSAWDRELFGTMLLTSVGLAVAAVPEGLPAVIAVTLALGSQRMARRRAIVRRLAAVETLGSVSVICSDKTGTLTKNEMVVEDHVVPGDLGTDGSRDGAGEPQQGDDGPLGVLRRAAILCNDAQPAADGPPVGSATEVALLTWAAQDGLDPRALRAAWPRLDEIPFSSARKRMTTLHRGPDGTRVIVAKGAADRLVALCGRQGSLKESEPLDDAARRTWQEKVDALARRGRRVLALAVRSWDKDDVRHAGEAAERDLVLVGLVGIVDPVRPEVRDAVARCRSAGIRTVMITGDHGGTARAIADELEFADGEELLTGPEVDRLDDDGLRERAGRTGIYARVSPEHKLRIVRAHQELGQVVAMTGDGVNDAPALKQADIGVAMGVTGTDVSREAAQMVLADDHFATIVAAVEEGRVVYDNILKFVGYLLTANFGEVLVLVLALACGLPLPLLPVHILWINLVTDGLPALALGFEPAEPDVMRRRPRPRDESVFAHGLGARIVVFGTWMGAACTALFALALPTGTSGADPPDADLAAARTLVFVTLSTFQLFFVYALRSTTRSCIDRDLATNWRLLGAVAIGFVLQYAVVYVPLLQPWFRTVPLTGPQVALSIAVASSALIGAEAWKLFRRLKRS